VLCASITQTWSCATSTLSTASEVSRPSGSQIAEPRVTLWRPHLCAPCTLDGLGTLWGNSRDCMHTDMSVCISANQQCIIREDLERRLAAVSKVHSTRAHYMQTPDCSRHECCILNSRDPMRGNWACWGQCSVALFENIKSAHAFIEFSKGTGMFTLRLASPSPLSCWGRCARVLYNRIEMSFASAVQGTPRRHRVKFAQGCTA
jgi:hypothetical protein